MPYQTKCKSTNCAHQLTISCSYMTPWQDRGSLFIWLFVCLFVIVLPVQEFFTHVETLPVKGSTFWPIYTRHSWPWSGKGPSTFQTYGTSVCVWLSPRTRDTHTCYQVWISSGPTTTCFKDLSLSRPRFEHPTFRLLPMVPPPQRQDFRQATKAMTVTPLPCLSLL